MVDDFNSSIQFKNLTKTSNGFGLSPRVFKSGGGAALLLRPASVGRFAAKSPSASKVTEDERAHAGGGRFLKWMVEGLVKGGLKV